MMKAVTQAKLDPPIIEDLVHFGHERGLREGIERGRTSEKAAAVLDVLDARGLTVAEVQRERILGCTDLDTLTRWLRRAVTAASADELFA